MKFLSILMFEISNSRRVNSISHLIRMFVSSAAKKSTRKSVAISEKHKRSENEFEQNDFPQVSNRKLNRFSVSASREFDLWNKKCNSGKQRSTPIRPPPPPALQLQFAVEVSQLSHRLLLSGWNR